VWRFAVAAVLAGCASTPTAEAPRVDSAASTQSSGSLRASGRAGGGFDLRFRSSVGEITARGSTDMFTTALIQSGQFRVVERSRLNDGVIPRSNSMPRD